MLNWRFPIQRLKNTEYNYKHPENCTNSEIETQLLNKFSKYIIKHWIINFCNTEIKDHNLSQKFGAWIRTIWLDSDVKARTSELSLVVDKGSPPFLNQNFHPFFFTSIIHIHILFWYCMFLALKFNHMFIFWFKILCSFEWILLINKELFEIISSRGIGDFFEKLKNKKNGEKPIFTEPFSSRFRLVSSLFSA